MEHTPRRSIKEIEATARLEAAAPALLSALEEIAADAGNAVSGEYALDADDIAYRARAAILAAKGEAND